MSYKITINRAECIGCGSCEAICLSNFKLDEKDHKSRVKKEIVKKLTCEQAAADACPVNVIKIEEIKK